MGTFSKWRDGVAMLVLLLVLISTHLSASGITIIVNDIPEYTPSEDSIFLTGSFNRWDPSDSQYLMTRRDDGSYIYTFKEEILAFEYKFTRGGWHSVEGSVGGVMRENRIVVYDAISENIIVARIDSWIDLAILAKPRLTIFLDAPANTPYDASLYLTGDFNTWDTSDPDFKFKKTSKQTYSLKLPPGLDTLRCKVTRGSWETVEGRPNGKARVNRDIAVGPNDSKELKIVVETWEDLTNPFSIYSFILLFAVFQGLLLVIMLYSVQNNNREANRYLLLLIGLASLALLAKVAAYDRVVFQTYPKLLLVPEFIFFLYAPLFYRYVQKLITTTLISMKWFWTSLIPLLIFILANIPALILDNHIFIIEEVNNQFDNIFAIIGALGFIYNGLYWIRSKRLIQQVRKTSEDTYSFEQNLNYLTTVLILQSICLVVWLLVFIVSLVGIVMEINVITIVEYLSDAVWVIFASINFILGYFAMNQPKIFQIKEDEKYKDAGLAQSDMEKMKAALEYAMNHDQVYLNAQLTLAQLSKEVNTNTHTLSRVINEGFGKNFYDFINEYRVQTFIEEAKKEENKDQAMLAIAFKVGFNSKTSFNRAFKKSKNSTPRDFLVKDN